MIGPWISHKVDITDRDGLFTYLDKLNDKLGTDFTWHWSGTDERPNVEVYSPKLGLAIESTMGFIQEHVERMLPIWGLVSTE